MLMRDGGLPQKDPNFELVPIGSMEYDIFTYIFSLILYGKCMVKTPYMDCMGYGTPQIC